MRLVRSVAELDLELNEWRFRRESVALVPTMGNLHAGHASLIRRARELAECVVVSVFVNPLQFGPRDDFERYPRTLEADARIAESQGAHLLWAPDVSAMYPAGYPPATTVQIGGLLEEILEGEFRPGHFAGVATVVGILFNRVRPDVAVFGDKDYQQLAVIRRMVADLGMPVRVVGSPTLRDADGLALSSRNQYLAPTQRALAPRLHAALEAVADAVRRGRRDFTAVCSEQKKILQNLDFRPQYLEVRSTDLQPPEENAQALVALAAAYLGETRLIDNLRIDLEKEL